MEASLAQDPGMAGVNPPLRHPGPVVEPRVSAIPTAIRHFDIALTGEIPLEEAILTAFSDQGLTGGAVEIDGLECTAIDYVIPAQSEFPDRLAWYSAPRSPKGPARILQAYASVGMDHGAGMTHCHGIWRLADGRRAMGHLLGPKTMPAPGQVLRAIGFEHALFDRRPDPETNFDLFAASGDGSETPQAIVVTLRPNEDIPTTCMRLCAQYGFDSARVIGLGSLNGAGFIGVSAMQDHVSEFLIRSGRASPTSAEIDIAVVDSGANCFEGVLATGQGRVSITSEIVLLSDPAGL